MSCPSSHGSRPEFCWSGRKRGPWLGDPGRAPRSTACRRQYLRGVRPSRGRDGRECCASRSARQALGTTRRISSRRSSSRRIFFSVHRKCLPFQLRNTQPRDRVYRDGFCPLIDSGDRRPWNRRTGVTAGASTASSSFSSIEDALMASPSRIFRASRENQNSPEPRIRSDIQDCFAALRVRRFSAVPGRSISWRGLLSWSISQMRGANCSAPSGAVLSRRRFQISSSFSSKNSSSSRESGGESVNR